MVFSNTREPVERWSQDMLGSAAKAARCYASPMSKTKGNPSPWAPPVNAAPKVPECAHCGAPASRGLANCSFCGVAYVGVPRGATCPACSKVNASRRTACAACGHDLTRPCARCSSRSPLELVACWHCHCPFHDGGKNAGAKPGSTTAQDPCDVLSALDDILKS